MRTAAIAIFNLPFMRAGAARRFSYIVIIGALFVAGILWYILSVNAVIAAGYQVSDAVAQKEAVQADLEALQASIVNVSRPEELESRAKELGFQPVRNPSYLAVPGDVVARR